MIRQPHFTAVIEWETSEVHILSRKAAGDRVPQQKFQRQWERGGNQYLLLTPAS